MKEMKKNEINVTELEPVKKVFRSPIIPDIVLSISYDEDGNEIREWITPNYKEMFMSNGEAGDWSLNNMLKAGISPEASIHTSGGCRLENYGDLGTFIATADEILKVENTANEVPIDNE